MASQQILFAVADPSPNSLTSLESACLLDSYTGTFLVSVSPLGYERQFVKCDKERSAPFFLVLALTHICTVLAICLP